MKKREKVLIISYWYPPKRTIGALRLAKWVKYLPDFGWEPVVVTVAPRTNLYTRHGTLPDEVRCGRVYRTRDLSLNELLYAFGERFVDQVVGQRMPHDMGLHDSRQGWLFFSLRKKIYGFGYMVYKHLICFPDEVWPWLLEYPKIEAIARKEQPDVLLSSSLPNTSHLIASWLSQNLGIPWVADFRDLWTQNHVFRRILPLHSLEVILEKKTLKPAVTLITVSEPLKAQLENLHGKPVYVIPNGFDPDDFPDETACFNPTWPLRIVYTGLIYPKHRDPSPLFAALQTLLDKGEIQAGEMQIDFYGRRLHVIRDLLERYPSVRPLVRLKGEVPYREALLAQCSADVLLLLEWTDPKAQGVYTGKVFEYLGARRPILSIGPAGGVIEKLLKETQAGVHVQSAEEIVPWLLRWLEEKRRLGYPSFTGKTEAIQRYTRWEQTRRLAEVLSKALGP